MNILAVSDIIEPFFYNDSLSDEYNNIDLILSCGDLEPEYLTLLRSRLNAPLYFVKGNHDIRYEGKPPEGCTDADCRIINENGVRILGIEGSRWYNGNPNQYTEVQMKKRIRKLWFELWRKKGVDIIFTHAPPRFIHDAEDLCHRGFHVFNRLIRKYQPRYFIHGHIHTHFVHPSERKTQIDQTCVLNTFGHYLFEY